MIDERTGCRALLQAFEREGLAIVEHYPLEIAGRTIRLDGYDPARRIGFEYLTTAAGDREELDATVVAELERRMQLGELYVLLLDEREVESTAQLERAATHFLRTVVERTNEGAP